MIIFEIRRRRLLAAAGVSGLALAQALSAHAQDASTSGVQEVVVTATKRTERLQDVPVSVAVVTADKLAQDHITNLQDLPLLSPSLSFNDSNSARGQGLSIRGVGTLSFSDGVEPSVSTVIDGVVLGRQAMSTFDLIDIDHVEVLRGPQGTLFGKNSSAGVINIVTLAPSFRFGGAYSASYSGDLNETKLQGTVTGPLVEDKLAGRLTAYYDSSDGFIHDITTGTDLNAVKQYGVRGKLLFTPTPTTNLTLIADYSKNTGDCCAPTIRSVTANSSYFGKPYSSYVLATPGPDNEETSAGTNSLSNQTGAGLSLQADQRLGGGFTLTSISAFRQYEVYDNIDSDLTALNLLDLNNANQHQDQFSQEVRITSPKDQPIEFVAGAYYFYQGLKTETQVAGDLGAVPPPAFLGSQVNRNIHLDNEALFGQATWHLTQKLSLIGGLRYTDEEQHAYFIRTKLPGAIAATPISVAGPPLIATNLASHEQKLSDHFGVQYDFTPDVMAYASYSRGFKGAALNLLNFLSAQQVATGRYLVPPEIPTDYEIGVRTAFFQHRLQLNATVFDENFKGFQATAFDAISMSNTLVSAGELRSRGVEIEALAAPMRGLNFSANIAYTDAAFTDFPNGPCYPGELLAAGGRCHLVDGAYVQNLKGEPLNNAPRWALTFGGDYTRPIYWRGLEGFVDANYSWRSKVNYSLSEDPNTIQGAYGILTMNVGVQTPGGRLRLAVFARNLTDERYASFIYPSSFQAGSPTQAAGYSQFFPEAARHVVGVSLSGKF